MKLPSAAACALALAVLSPTVVQAADTRQLVEMPEPAREVMRQQMLEFLGALNQIIGLVADNKFKEAGAAAEEHLGSASMGRHGGMAGMGPGRFMPDPMRSIAMGLHASGSELARVAASGDRAGTLDALQTLTNACVSCHAAYRTR